MRSLNPKSLSTPHPTAEIWLSRANAIRERIKRAYDYNTLNHTTVETEDLEMAKRIEAAERGITILGRM